MKDNVNLKVDWCSYDAAKYACKNWHYSKCLPAGKIVKIGAWENGKFIGVVLFSRGATANIGKPYSLGQNEVCELTRVALTNHVSFVSQIMKLAIFLLKKKNPGLKLIVSYADSGQDHTGAIYQATNWIYEGSFGGEVYLEINGKVMHRRSVFSLYGTSSIEKIPNAKKILASAKHKYLMPLNKKMRKKIIKLSKPYPKKAELLSE